LNRVGVETDPPGVGGPPCLEGVDQRTGGSKPPTPDNSNTDLEALTLQDSNIGRHAVTELDSDDVTDDEFFGRSINWLAVAYDKARLQQS
jgi:hypothetical protein